jgi:hypothetical protein
MRITAPIVIAESATLNAGQCQPKAWKSTKVDHLAEAQPVDDVAERAAEDQREAEAEQARPGCAR